MDLQELKEEAAKKQQAAEEEKVKTNLQRQVRLLKKEKEIYAHKTSTYINHLQITLGFLQHEKPIEVENYLATQSESVEKKYRKEENIVSSLVKTTDIVRDLLNEETELNKKLAKKIDKVRDETFECRKAAMLGSVERNKFRVPSSEKMDRRIEHANSRYHAQRQRNFKLKEKIDNALITRDIFVREETKLDKEIKILQDKVLQVMGEAGHFYEERDRIEGTRLKLQEHLTKVKESCVRELQGLTSTLTEDKGIEHFMRIKQKDIGGYIRDMRAKEKAKIKEMLSKTDEHVIMFDRIKRAIGKDDIVEIMQSFIEGEENNFGTFRNIGELMDDNERLRCQIRDLSSDNVDMETVELDMTASRQDGVKAVNDRIATMKMKKALQQKKMEENKVILGEFYDKVKTLISVLQMDTNKMKSLKDGAITRSNMSQILTEVEEAMASVLHDFTMVEMATRASLYNKAVPLSPDQVMLLRQPSVHLKLDPPPRFTSLSIHKSHEMDPVKESANLMTFDEVRDQVTKSMQAQSERRL